MAKKSSRNRSGRDDLTPSTPSLSHRLPRPIAFSTPSNYQNLLEVEDLRTFYPDENRPALLNTGRPHSLQYPSPKKTRLNKDRFSSLRSLSSRVQFAQPENVLVCVRRKRRKEVLFAKQKTGRGKKQRRPRRGRWSSISC